MSQFQITNSLGSDAIIEGMDCAIIVVSATGLVVRVNLAAENIFYTSRRKLLNMKIDELITDQKFLNCIQDSINNGAQYTLREMELIAPEQTSLVDATVSALLVDESISNQGLSGHAPVEAERMVLIEISSINRISRFMTEKNQLERQQSFRLMMRSLAHEIKNPLGGIRGAAQLLDRELHQPSQQELTDILIKEADRLTRLVDRVMGSREALRPVSVNIHEVLEHVLNLVQVKHDEQIVIQRFYDPALPEIRIDKEQMIQAVLNVVGNAVEAQDESRIITIGLSTQFERFVTINQSMHRQVLKILIWDEGPGVPEDMRHLIFDPLITGRADGTGLGLSITQEIAQRHQGIVQLEDHQGKTCFSIYLPYLEEQENEVKQHA